jgi:hypothetical protein
VVRRDKDSKRVEFRKTLVAHACYRTADTESHISRVLIVYEFTEYSVTFPRLKLGMLQ